jgi:hypothetical protein
MPEVRMDQETQAVRVNDVVLNEGEDSIVVKLARPVEAGKIARVRVDATAVLMAKPEPVAEPQSPELPA